MRCLGTTLLATILLAPAAGAQSTIVITGATVHTMGPQGTLENATVVIENGKIRAVGTSGMGVAVPASARRIDAHGKVVTPGLFDSLSQIGLVEVGAVETTVDNHSNDDRVTAAFRVADGINPRSVLIPVNRVEGLTRVMAYPGNGKSLIAGQGAIIDLSGDLSGPEGYLIRSPAAMFASLGEAGRPPRRRLAGQRPPPPARGARRRPRLRRQPGGLRPRRPPRLLAVAPRPRGAGAGRPG